MLHCETRARRYAESAVVRHKPRCRNSPRHSLASSNTSYALQCVFRDAREAMVEIQRDALTLTLPGPSAGLSGSLDSYCSLKPLCSGMGEVVPARTSPTLLPPSPRTVLSLSCFKVLPCINCCDWHCKS